jgi:peptidoglycan/LPS O-acetylase OafA/YrhL
MGKPAGYLSHALVLVLVQWTLFLLFPQATQAQHFLMLAPLTIVFTILASAILYYSIEAPFIKLGSKVAKGKTMEFLTSSLKGLKKVNQ